MIVNAIFFVFISLSLFLVLAFIEPSSLRTISGLSLMYCVKFLDPLRGKFGNFFKQKVKDSVQSEVEKNFVAFVPFY